MALEIQRNARAVGALVSDRPLYLTNDKSQVVEEGDVRAGWLFATRGWEISAADVARYDLAVVDGVVVVGGAEAAAPVVEPPAEAPVEASAKVPTEVPVDPEATPVPEEPAPAEVPVETPSPVARRTRRGRSGGS